MVLLKDIQGRVGKRGKVLQDYWVNLDHHDDYKRVKTLLEMNELTFYV